MTKVMIDTDKISGSLLPTTANAYKQVSTAGSYASRVYFPYGDYNWGNIASQINDCAAQSRKYYNWANELSKKFVRSLQQSVDEVSTIRVEEIRKSDLNVK